MAELTVGDVKAILANVSDDAKFVVDLNKLTGGTFHNCDIVLQPECIPDTGEIVVCIVPY